MKFIVIFQKTALVLAIEQHNIEIVKLLLKNKMNYIKTPIKIKN